MLWNPWDVKCVDGERGRFWVPSDKAKEKPYLVDVCALDGNGACDCIHFRCRLEPHIKRDRNGMPLRCKHIVRARSFVLDTMIADINLKEKAAAHAIRHHQGA